MFDDMCIFDGFRNAVLDAIKFFKSFDYKN